MIIPPPARAHPLALQGTAPAANAAQLTINQVTTERSQFGFAELLVYNRALAAAEFTTITNYLLSSYCLTATPPVQARVRGRAAAVS